MKTVPFFANNTAAFNNKLCS